MEPQSNDEYVFDPEKVTIKFIFANRDGLNVSSQHQLSDTVGTVKQLLLSKWPSELSKCSEIERIRIICMGKGVLEDKMTLKETNIPIFESYPTPMNVSIKPLKSVSTGSSLGKGASSSSNSADVDCCCVMM